MTNPPTLSIKSYGLILSAPQRYLEGHILSAVEAETLSQLLIDNCRNNFGVTMKLEMAKAGVGGSDATKLDPATQGALRAAFLTKVEGYSFATVPSRTPADSVKALAEKLAHEAISGALRLKGIDPKSRDAAWFKDRVASVIQSDPRFIKGAEERLAQAAEAASRVLDDFTM